jgi:hypothetical protein
MLVLFIKVVGCGFHGGWGVPKRIGGQSRENNSLYVLKSGVHLSSVLRLYGFENAPKDKAEETEAKHCGRHKRESNKRRDKKRDKEGERQSERQILREMTTKGMTRREGERQGEPVGEIYRGGQDTVYTARKAERKNQKGINRGREIERSTEGDMYTEWVKDRRRCTERAKDTGRYKYREGN